MAGKFDLDTQLSLARERDINRSIERADSLMKSEASPYPDNRSYNLAWFNREFTIDGEYKPSDGENCGIVADNINWVYRQLLRTPLGLYSGDRRIERHPVLDLLKKPNKRHTYGNLLYSLTRSLYISGDGLIEKLEYPELGLQYVPYQWLRQQLPQNNEQMLQYWMHSWTDYRKINSQNVAHMIWQPYDRNQYIGESPLVPVYAEIKLDRAAMEGAYGRLNSPIAGLVMQPKEVDGAPITEQEKEELKDQSRRLRGTHAGQMLLIEGRFEVQELSGAVQRFTYKEFHDLAEERISSVFGIHPRVVYLGAGLKQTQGIGSNMDAEIRLSWENGAKPFGTMLAEGLSRHLLPMLGFDGLELRFDFDAIDISTEEEKMAKLDRVKKAEDYGYITHEEALRELGYGS